MVTKPIPPWQDPEFKFYTDDMRRWLLGYQPVVADRLMNTGSAAQRETTPYNNNWIRGESRGRMGVYVDMTP